MFIINKRNIFIAISGFLVVCSLTLTTIFGLPLGIDFKGGTLLEVAYTTERPSVEVITETIAPLEYGQALIQPTGDMGMIIKTRELTDTEKQVLVQTLKEKSGDVVEKSYTTIGPSVGHELTRKAIISMILVMLGIIIFIAYSFRGISKPVQSWKYGIIAIITLIHDIIIPVGMFSVIAHFTGAEVDTLFVAAVLTILGLSVSDTIVVFDRIRENINTKKYTTFFETVGRSIEQTYVRSINTSLTVIITLLALFFFGPVATKTFSLMLAVGMFFGTYSSIFLASPMVVKVFELQKKEQ